MPRVRQHIQVAGVVQGVGFRPYVYRLATEERLSGHISNDTAGVTIEIEGPDHAVASFLRRLPAEAPPLARIRSVTATNTSVTGSSGFHIEHSHSAGAVVTQIPADAATCDDCLRELLDPGDRRYLYPFINCTNCGPRFTITRRIPYDRPQTSMARFRMCDHCQAEYDDPLSRRFHAQPNACWICGPQLWLTDAGGERLDAADPVAETIRRLARGEIVAIKGVGGFHLAVDATSDTAVQRLRRRKHRHGKPLAIMVRDLAAAASICALSDDEQRLLTGPEHPIVLLHKRAGIPIAPSVAPGIPWLGVFLPYTPLHHLLFAAGKLSALVMTSANLSEEPIAIDNEEALNRLAHIADTFLFHDRDILQRSDDSVLHIVAGQPQFLRRARGFVPLPVDLPISAPPLLAVGGHLKNVFTLASGRLAYQSQHLGDLENLTGLEFFEEALAHLKRTFEIEPATIVHDLHPGYLSTQWAERQPLPRIAVQHHHAHIAACIAEHALTGRVIGLSLDGTGYGTDGHIWGGEVLLASLDRFQRFGHLKYTAMPGSAAAIREPWRMAFSHLLAAIGDDALQPRILDRLGLSTSDARNLARIIERGFQSPLTSSCGRLFDAAAALITGRRSVDYEAQAAIELEGLALDAPDETVPESTETRYQLAILHGDSDWIPGRIEDAASHEPRPWQLDPAPLFRALLDDLGAGTPPPLMSLRVHAAIAAGYAQLAEEASRLTGITQVCLSGGVFHNALLTRLIQSKLTKSGFQVFLQTKVSPGDGGLSYGQAAVAAAQLAGSGIAGNS
jgi:hydrogenase maturation protein HypF